MLNYCLVLLYSVLHLGLIYKSFCSVRRAWIGIGIPLVKKNNNTTKL